MRRLGVVGITLLGLWTAVGAVNGLLTQFSFSTSDDGFRVDYGVTLYVVPAIILLVLGIALIGQRDRLASRWFDDEPLQFDGDTASLLRLGIILVGLVISITALEPVLYAILRPVIVAASDRAAFGDGFAEPFSLAAVLPGILARGVELVAALLLVWFSGPLSGWLWTHRRPVMASESLEHRPVCPTCGAPYDPADYETGTEARCVQCGETLNAGGA